MPEDGFALLNSKVAILGLGLMGGSLALALKGKCAALFGIDPEQSALELALRQAIVDRADRDPARLLPEADIVILAAPVGAILSILEALPSLDPNPCVVMDLGSTKQRIVEVMEGLPERFDPIGGHPLCGKEKLSLANAERTLYYQAPFLLAPLKRTSARAVSAAKQVIEAIGARTVMVDPGDHDRALAYTSHMPFLLAAALVLSTPEEAARFIGPGYRSAGRLAGTPASMMLGILRTNRQNVLKAVTALQEQLAELKHALAAEDEGSLEALLDRSQKGYYELMASED